jgi:hypothetical protein
MAKNKMTRKRTAASNSYEVASGVASSEEQTEQAPVGSEVPATSDRLEEFAEDLGRLLGTAQVKAQGWMNQRKAIAEHLIGVRDTAAKLLAQLGVGDAPAPAKRGRKPGSKNLVASNGQEPWREPGRPVDSGVKKRIMSPEARERIAAAQRARWAKQKKAAGKG